LSYACIKSLKEENAKCTSRIERRHTVFVAASAGVGGLRGAHAHTSPHTRAVTDNGGNCADSRTAIANGSTQANRRANRNGDTETDFVTDGNLWR